jgi:hypothetical protein
MGLPNPCSFASRRKHGHIDRKAREKDNNSPFTIGLASEAALHGPLPQDLLQLARLNNVRNRAWFARWQFSFR